jgi:hypothetical protein
MIIDIRTEADYRRLALKCYRLRMEHYVYRYWSPITEQCFYVGKGQLKRAWHVKNRPAAFKAHMRLLAKKKLAPIVMISHWSKTHDEALYKESQIILFLLSKGHPLASERISNAMAFFDGKWRRLRSQTMPRARTRIGTKPGPSAKTPSVSNARVEKALSEALAKGKI